MIETKHLVEFIKEADFRDNELADPYIESLYREYISEIVARLRAYDKLKESIEKLCRRLSNEGDKGGKNE